MQCRGLQEASEDLRGTRGGLLQARMSGGDGDSPPADLGQIPEEVLLAWDKGDLVQRLRRAEADKISALVQRGRLMKEVNRQLQEHLLEIRELKLANGRLQEDNQELRDLCCFLDQDRLKVRRLARDWQGFGRQAAQVMRGEVAGYLAKLARLERLQGALARDNLELRELCLVLVDEEAAAAAGTGAAGGGVSRSDSSLAGSSELNLPCGPRDLGDGSSSTGSLGSPDQIHLVCSPED